MLYYATTYYTILYYAVLCYRARPPGHQAPRDGPMAARTEAWAPGVHK